MTNAILRLSTAFYSQELLTQASKNDRPLSASMSLDETDKIKEQWAFNMPCVLLVNGSKHWPVIKPIYDILIKETTVISIQKSMAAGLIEVAKLINLKE